MRIRLNVTQIDGYSEQGALVEGVWGDRVDYINFEPHMAVTRETRITACRTLFRSASIGWDGTVGPCCVDMGQTLAFGKLQPGDDPLKIINGEVAQNIRKRHLKGDYPEICREYPGFYG